MKTDERKNTVKDLNSIMLTGRLSRDPELRYTQTGAAICKFDLAFTTSKKHGDEWQEQSNFIAVDVFGRQAEFIAESCTKGAPVCVLGRIEQERWQSQDGGNRSRISLKADQVRLMFARDKQESGQKAAYGAAQPGYDYYDEDCPF